MTATLLGLPLSLLVFTLLWGLSLRCRDASIIDRFWGVSFIVLAAWYVWNASPPVSWRLYFVLALVTIWGLRLSFYIHFRNRGKGEDPRYVSMREKRGSSFAWKSLFIIFWFQGFLSWLLSVPIAMLASHSGAQTLTFLDVLGVALWGIGFAFEVLGDSQLSRFKALPENKGKLLRDGVWAYTRHPNYFGEALLWWGIFLIACNNPNAWISVFSPILLTFLLLKVSGVALLEKSLSQSKPGYEDYVREVPAFFPRFKK